MNQKYFSGPTLTQALLAAARHHQVNPDDLAYSEIDRKHGSLKPSRTVVIEVDPENPTLKAATEEVDAATPSAQTPEADPPELLEVVDSTGAALAEEITEEPLAKPDETPATVEALDEPISTPEPAEEVAPEAETPETEAPTEPLESAGQPSWLPPAPAGDGEDAPPAWVEDAAPVDSVLDDLTEPVPAEAVPTVVEAAEEPERARAQSDAPSRREPIEIDDTLRAAVIEGVDQLAHLAGLRVQVASISSFEDGLNVELEGPDAERMTTKGGRSLLAIQHLLPRLLFATLGRAPHCRVDSGDFHASRVERLEQLALKAAERVRSGGRSWLLDPMPPDERRLVHMALADEPGVETESVGKGFLKRVRVAQA